VIPIVLASASPSRAALLEAAGVPFAVRTSSLNEDSAKDAMRREGASPAAVAEALAELKAMSVSRHAPGLVIGADQTLELDGALYGKTRTLAETRARLESLRGRRHSLHAAVAVARDGSLLWRTCSTAVLSMRSFSDAFLRSYLDRCGAAVASSVGAYHLEGEGVQLFDAIDGDYFAILGLPLLPLLSFLRSAGGLPC
jgi:septum formation protein